MKTKTCYIVGAGENYGLDFTRKEDDFVIAADGGLIYLQEKHITPDLIIGDFDSMTETPVLTDFIKLSVNKDDTDTLAAVRQGIKLGYNTFKIYCGTGGRIDHTMANIQTLAFLSDRNKRGYLIDKNCIITAITNDKITFEKSESGYISVFSLTDKSDGVCISGLKFKLENATLTNTFPIGVSNEFIGKESCISVKSGTLIVVYPKNVKEQIL